MSEHEKVMAELRTISGHLARIAEALTQQPASVPPRPAPRGAPTGPPPEPLLTAQQVAELLQVPVKTVYTWSARNAGPPRLRIGKHLRYQRREVEEWVTAQWRGGG